MKMKYVYVLAFSLVFILEGCVVNEYTYYEYSTNLPSYTIPEYNRIDKSLYNDYFLNDLYLTVNITPTYYPSAKRRTGSPYRIWFYAVSKNKKYKIMKIDHCKCFSTIKGEYFFDWIPVDYYFDDGTKYENSIFYYAPKKLDEHPIDLNIEAKENVQIDFELALIDTNNSEYRKHMSYILKPNVKTRYIETLVENW